MTSKPLYSIVKSISTGLNPRQNFVLNEGNACYYYVTVKEITTNKVVFSNSTDKITKDAKQIINNRSKLERGDILFSGIGTIGKVAYVDIPTTNWDCSESVFIIKPNESEVLGKYLSYILSSDIAKNQYERGAAGAIMKGVRKATLESLQIPIPSLSEQNRIVGILDTFTASIENLKEQIAQRRKQYEYYRDQLLDLEGKEGVEMKTLGEIGDFIRGNGIQKNDFVEEGFSCIHYGQIHAKYGFSSEETISKIEKTLYDRCKKAKKGDVVLATTSEDAEGVAKPFVWLGEDDAAVSGDAFIFHHNQNGKFIGHQFLTHKFMQFKIKYATGAKVVRISGDNMAKYEVALPSIEKQNEIVDILNKFEASIQNLESQLSQREKQYEYYRNKLLTFD